MRGLRLIDGKLQAPDEGWPSISVYYCSFPKGAYLSLSTLQIIKRICLVTLEINIYIFKYFKKENERLKINLTMWEQKQSVWKKRNAPI